MDKTELEKKKEKYLKPMELCMLAEKSDTYEEYKLYESLLFNGMLLFKDEEACGFYPTFSHGLMMHSLKNLHKFSNDFNYEKYFKLLLQSDNKCNLGQMVYLFGFLSRGENLFTYELNAEDQNKFNERKNKFLAAFNKEQFLKKCDELKLVPSALGMESYLFLKNSLEEQNE